MTLAHLVGTVFYIGHLRPAPGTWGSLAALPAAWAVHSLFGFPGLAVATMLAFGAGWWSCLQITHDQDNKDPSEVVVDEVVGQWIAVLPLSQAAWSMDLDILQLYPGWIGAFVLFRLFDIWKPGPVGWADRRGDGLGIMLDDVIAGVFAAIGVVVLAGLAHGVLGL